MWILFVVVVVILRCSFHAYIYLFVIFLGKQRTFLLFSQNYITAPTLRCGSPFPNPYNPAQSCPPGRDMRKRIKEQPLKLFAKIMFTFIIIFNSSPVSASRWFPAYNLRFTFSQPSVKAGRNFYFQQSDIWRLNLSFEQLFVVNTAYGWIYVHKYVCIYVNLYLHTNKLCNEEVGGGHGPAAQVQRQTYLELSWNLHTYIISINVFFEGFQINILANVNLLVIQVNVIKLRRAGRSVHFFATFFLFNIHTYANYSHLHTQM